MDAPQTDLSWDLETPDLAVVKREVGRFLKPFTLEAHTQHRYRARLFRRRLRSADLAVIDYGGAVTVDAGRISRCYLLQVPLSGAYTVRTAGRPLQVNTRFAHLISPGTPLDMTWTHDCRILVLRFNEAAMAACLRHEHRPPSDMSGGELLALDAAPNQSLARILDYVTREATTGHLFDHVPLAAAHAESLLFAGLRSTVTPERERRTHRSAPAYVRRAESFLLQHLEMPGVKVADVVRAAGTSRRTLFDGFKRAHGVGPLHWLHAERLQRVRTELLAATDGRQQVTDIAMRWGFQHLGRFSAAYRQRFGETPTATLHRQR